MIALAPEPQPSTDELVSVVSAKRVRLSPEQKAALVNTVEGIVKAAGKDGLPMGEIIAKAGASESAVRDAVKKAKFKMTGAKATARYSAK